MKNKNLAKLILIQLDAIKTADKTSDILVLINETLRDAKQLAEQVDNSDNSVDSDKEAA